MAVAFHHDRGSRGCAEGWTSGGLPDRSSGTTGVRATTSWRNQLSATSGGPDGTATKTLGHRLGLTSGMVVQELGWDEDVDDDLRIQIEDAIDADLVGGGVIWLLTPKVGRDNAVDPADVAEAAPIAGLATTTTAAVSKDWTATRLVAPKTAH